MDSKADQILAAVLDLKGEASSHTAELRAIRERLGTLNGTVARHEMRFAEVEGGLSKTQSACALRLEEREAAKRAEDAAEKASAQLNERYWKYTRPALMGAGAVTAAMGFANYPALKVAILKVLGL
jgi:surface antigen